VRRSYLVQWTGWGHEYTDWVPVEDVNLKAVDEFNPRAPVPGGVGDGLEEAMTAQAEFEEWASTHAVGTMRLLETAQMPFYDQLGRHAMGMSQRGALESRRSKSKKKRSSSDGLPGPKRARSEARSAGESELDHDRYDAMVTDTAAAPTGPPGRSPALSLRQADAPVAQRLSSTLSSRRSKAAARPPTLLALNAQADAYHKVLLEAATACDLEWRSQQQQPALDDAEMRRTTAAATAAVKKLHLPNGGPPHFAIAKHHLPGFLRKCLLVPPTKTFVAVDDSFKCLLCNGMAKLASLAKVKKHQLTKQHMLKLQLINRDPGIGGVPLADVARAAGKANHAVATLPRTVALRAAVMTSQHGHPLTAAAHALRLSQSVVYDITGGTAPPVDVIARLRRPARSAELAAASALAAVDPEEHASVIAELRRGSSATEKVAADQLMRLRQVSVRQPDRHGNKPPLHLDRTNVSRALEREIEPMVDMLTDALLDECRYVALLMDESKSTSSTDPCYLGIQYCTPSFMWGLHLVGQTDTSICTSGADLLTQLKTVFASRGSLWDKILFGSTDGCAAMRSTRKYAGLHPRQVGESLLRWLQEDLASRRVGDERTVDLCPRLMFLHCIAHILALAFLNACAVLPPHVIPHLRSFHRNFHNKLKEWSELKDICVELKIDLDRTNALREGGANPINNKRMWRVTQFKSLSPTRWKDLLRVTVAVIDKWEALVVLRKRRCDAGYGSPDNDDKSWDGGKKKAGDDPGDDDGSDSEPESSDDEDDGDSDDDDGDGDDVDINGIPASAKRGGSTKWRELGNVRCTGHCGAHPVANAVASSAKKRSHLLSDGLGVTPLNHAIDSMLADLLQTHVDLVTLLETRGQPIAHMCARWIRTYYRRLKARYIDGCGVAATYGEVYSAARTYYLDVNAGNEPEIIEEVDNLAKSVSEALISSAKARLKPYWATLCAFELADPSMDLPGAADADAVWAAAKVLCTTAKINYDAFRVQTTNLHTKFADLAGDLKADCSKNVLRFYHNCAKSGGFAESTAVRDYAVLVFTFPCTTVFIECLFSGMNLKKSTMRSSMTDGKCVAVLKARELKEVLTSDDGKPEPALALNVQSALEHNIAWWQ